MFLLFSLAVFLGAFNMHCRRRFFYKNCISTTFLCLEPDQTDQICFFIISGVSIVSAPDYQCHSLERGDNICCCCEFLNSNTCMLILVNRAEEKLSVHREIAKFLTVYRVCYTPIETLLLWEIIIKILRPMKLTRISKICVNLSRFNFIKG